MKRFILSALVLFTGIFTVQAQNSNAVFFSENGEGFTIVMNGLRMNEGPVTNLKVTDLNQPGYKVKVIFENTALGEFDKNIYFNDPGMEIVYNIKKNKKGDYKLAYQSATPIAQAPPAPPAQRVIVFGAPPVQTGGTVVIEETVTTTTTTGGSPTGTGENINMNVGINGFGMNVNVNTTDVNMNSSSTMTTTTTTTTTSSGNMGMTNDVMVVEEAPCPAMGPSDFSDACNSIRSKSFEDSKLTLAKQIIRGHCITSEQVRDMNKLFSFEDTRLEFAKYAYQYTIDPNQYYKVNDSFDFESTIEELDAYISGR